MNKELKEMRLRLKELDGIREKNYIVVYELRKFLNSYQNEFKKKESLEALKRIVTFLEPREKEYESAESEYSELEEKMQDMCSHEIIVKNGHGFYYCPICYENFYTSESNIRSTTSYVVELKSRRDEDISKMVDEALISEGDFIENIRNGLAEIQYESNVKIIRR